MRERIQKIVQEAIDETAQTIPLPQNHLGAALLEQAVLVPSNARWISLTMGAAKAFWGWVVGWGRTI